MTPRNIPGVEPEPQRTVPIGGSNVYALMARPGMPQTHNYDLHT